MSFHTAKAVSAWWDAVGPSRTAWSGSSQLWQMIQIGPGSLMRRSSRCLCPHSSQVIVTLMAHRGSHGGATPSKRVLYCPRHEVQRSPDSRRRRADDPSTGITSHAAIAPMGSAFSPVVPVCCVTGQGPRRHRAERSRRHPDGRGRPVWVRPSAFLPLSRYPDRLPVSHGNGANAPVLRLQATPFRAPGPTSLGSTLPRGARRERQKETVGP